MSRGVWSRLIAKARRWVTDIRAGSADAFVFALGCIALATLIRIGLGPILPAGAIPYLTYFPVILFATLIGGALAGGLALATSAVIASSLFVPEGRSFYLPSPDALPTAFFILSGSLIVWGAENYRRIIERLREEEHRRNLIIEELNHRAKNALSVAQAMVRQTVRNSFDLPATREAIDSRISALSQSHDLLTRSGWKGASLSELVNDSLKPFLNQEHDAGRLLITGENVVMSPKATLALSIMFHELATNAVKYGAFSDQNGTIHIDWSIGKSDIGNQIKIRWQEIGGPPVSPPTRNGFGSQVLERGMRHELNATVLLEHRRQGLFYEIDFSETAEIESTGLEPARQVSAAAHGQRRPRRLLPT